MDGAGEHCMAPKTLSERSRLTPARANPLSCSPAILTSRQSHPSQSQNDLIHHGSTGSGKHSIEFRHIWANDWFADLLNAHGWIVAFPQRRGRGGTDGLYDVGFLCSAVDSIF